MKNITQYAKKILVVGLLIATVACAGKPNDGRYTQAGEAQHTYNNDSFYGIGENY